MHMCRAHFWYVSLQGSIPWEKGLHIDGLTQHCINSIAEALELLHSSTKPSIWISFYSPLWWSLHKSVIIKHMPWQVQPIGRDFEQAWLSYYFMQYELT